MTMEIKVIWHKQAREALRKTMETPSILPTFWTPAANQLNKLNKQ